MPIKFSFIMNSNRNRCFSLKSFNIILLGFLFFRCIDGVEQAQNFKLNEVFKREQIASTSIATLVELLKNEEIFINAVQFYLNDLHRHINVWNKELMAIRAINSKLMQDPDASMANILNSYTTVRRLVDVWPSFLDSLLKPINNSYLMDIFEVLPTEDDLQEAAMGMWRVSKTYNLKPTEMAEGKLNGKQYDTKLSAMDCFIIGIDLLENEKSEDAVNWFKAALTSTNTETLKYDRNEYDFDEILSHYTLSLLKTNKSSTLLGAIQETLNDGNFEIFNALEDDEINSSNDECSTMQGTTEEEDEKYDELCRMEAVLPNNLYCRYNSTFAAFYKLAPFKYEELSLDPFVVRYYDVISDVEIEHFKNIVLPHLENVEVVDETQESGSRIETESRSGKGGTPSDEDVVAMKYKKRLEDITGLDMRNSDRFDVVNYGLGGHYAPHTDYLEYNEDHPEFQRIGERIATFLTYLTDVEKGGSTVFPKLNIAVKPLKGSAILWYNLDNSMEGDYRVLHGSCPTIVGSKWIATKWVRSHNQMFRKPCHR